MNQVVCVFCGSSDKLSDDLKQTAFILGQHLASQGYALVTGGANVGMMKEVVDGHNYANPSIARYGVIPTVFREFNVHHNGIVDDKMIWVEDIYLRLKTFYNLSDNLIVLPGGIGTLHELMDCIVHVQCNLITKRIFLLNINNFWDHTLAQFKVMVRENMVQQKHIDNLIVISSIVELITELQSEAVHQLVQGIETLQWE